MDGDRNEVDTCYFNGESIPCHGTHIFMHVRIHIQPILRISKSIFYLHPQTLESKVLTYVYGTTHQNQNTHDSYNELTRIKS